MIPEFVIEEVDSLRSLGFDVEIVEADGFWNVIFQKYPLPAGYTKAATTLLVCLPLSYKNGKPDMFWVEKDTLLANGGVPKNADTIETHVGREWRRFSWHPQSWNPGTDNLNTYLEFVNHRLSQVL